MAIGFILLKKKTKMTKSEILKGYFQKYPFMQNIHFCKIIDVPQNTLKSFLLPDENKNHRNLKDETIERIYPLIESIHFLITGYCT